MRKFIAGFVFGLAVGVAASVSAANVVGRDGYLMGWDVVASGGGVICRDPWIWTGTREIECD